MPRQNRVNPFGELIATNARGHFMGNRGVLHDSEGKLTQKRWTHNHWIICLTEFKDRKRELMSPGCYTELFFFDEATAMAAGHRPCAECRREDFNRFKQAWIEGNAGLEIDGFVSVDLIDRILQKERVTRSRQKVTYEDTLENLPNGTFVSLKGNDEQAWLLHSGKLHLWSPRGYGDSMAAQSEMMVNVLTPRSLVNAIAGGYEPQHGTSSGAQAVL